MPGLQDWCAQHGVSYTEVADLSGITVAYVSKIARGQREPTWHVKVRIARALGVRVADLFPAEPEVVIGA